jgi:ABC-2 type transport system ATP-binding protein
VRDRRFSGIANENWEPARSAVFLCQSIGDFGSIEISQSVRNNRCVSERNSDLALHISDVHKRFGQVHAVAGLSLEIRRGEVVALLGPNGAGKTTLIDMILGFSSPDSGLLTVFGGTPHAAVSAGEVSAVLQTGGLLKDYTVRETARVLERAGILAIANRKVGLCSGGQQQRLRFALALLGDPDLLLLDEPTTGMDVEGRREFWDAIRADVALGRTVIFATHYLDEADEYADRIVLMAAGQIVADGATEQIKNLVSGRELQVTLSAKDRAKVAKRQEVLSITEKGNRVTIHTQDSDSLAKFLLTETSAKDLEISSQSLESVFLKLTSNAVGGDK